MSEITAGSRKSKISIAANLMGSGSKISTVRSGGLKSLSRLGLRRKSYGFGATPGIRTVEKTSQLAMEYKRPVLMYLPTYQLEPSERFHVEHVTKIVKDTISENFSTHKYHTMESPALALRLAGEVMRKVKRLNYDRYRIFSVVTIGQKRAQSHNNAVAFLWDHERDNFVEANHETATAFIQIIVFGVYLD